MNRSTKKWLLCAMLSAAGAPAFAQMCYPVGTSMTLLGRATRESVQRSDGSAGYVWFLAMNPPLCIIDRRFSQDAQGRVSVSRLEIVGAAPPVGVPITVVGTIATRNSPQYFIVPTQLGVVPPNVRLAPGN